MKIGEVILKDEDIICNADKEAITIEVTNIGDRPIQVGSHYHFYEVNNGLEFERDKAYGKRLDIPAGAAVRFEPNDRKEINLIDFGGKREVYGFRNDVDGPLK